MGGRVSGGPVGFDCTKLRWSEGKKWFRGVSGKLHGGIRVFESYNRGRRSIGTVLEGRVAGNWNMFIQLAEFPSASRRVHIRSRYSAL